MQLRCLNEPTDCGLCFVFIGAGVYLFKVLYSVNVNCFDRSFFFRKMSNDSSRRNPSSKRNARNREESDGQSDDIDNIPLNLNEEEEERILNAEYDENVELAARIQQRRVREARSKRQKGEYGISIVLIFSRLLLFIWRYEKWR